jgi:hypothetical protein
MCRVAAGKSGLHRRADRDITLLDIVWLTSSD